MRQNDRMARTFTPRASYTPQGWFAEVWIDDASRPFWYASRFTRRGARFAATRMARKMSRLDQRGELR